MNMNQLGDSQLKTCTHLAGMRAGIPMPEF